MHAADNESYRLGLYDNGWDNDYCGADISLIYVRKMKILAYSFTFLVKFTRENKRFLSKKFVDVRSSEHAVAMDWRSLWYKKYKSIVFYENEIEIK